MAKQKSTNSPITEALKSNDDIDVGRRLREIRMGRGLSIRALAEECNLNVNTLSLIENGRTSPSVSTLQVIAQTLEIPISTFFKVNGTDNKIIFQRSGQRPRAVFTHGAMEDLGAGMPRYGPEPLIITLKPKADSGKTPIVHTGREFVYCLEGNITYHLDGQPYQLEQGDSLLFEAYLPHRWQNDNNTPSRMLLVLSPIDDHDEPSERHFGI